MNAVWLVSPSVGAVELVCTRDVEGRRCSKQTSRFSTQFAPSQVNVGFIMVPSQRYTPPPQDVENIRGSIFVRNESSCSMASVLLDCSANLNPSSALKERFKAFHPRITVGCNQK